MSSKQTPCPGQQSVVEQPDSPSVKHGVHWKSGSQNVCSLGQQGVPLHSSPLCAQGEQTPASQEFAGLQQRRGGSAAQLTPSCTHGSQTPSTQRLFAQHGDAAVQLLPLGPHCGGCCGVRVAVGTGLAVAGGAGVKVGTPGGKVGDGPPGDGGGGSPGPRVAVGAGTEVGSGGAQPSATTLAGGPEQVWLAKSMLTFVTRITSPLQKFPTLSKSR
jgi:hypothetical protein